MTQEEKDLLLKDLSARLLYHVKVKIWLEECIDWLEKQCYTKKDVDDAYLKGISDAKNELEKQVEKVEPIEGFNTEFERQISQLIASIINKEHEYTEAFVKWTSDALLNYAKHEIEKQGEQKTAVIDFNAKDWYVSKVDGKIHDMTYNPADKVEPKFKVKYAGSEYNVLEVKDIAGVAFYGIEDEPNHIDYVKADNCEIISGYGIKENDSPYPTKPSMFSEQKPAAWSEENKKFIHDILGNLIELKDRYGEGYGNVGKCIEWLKSLKSIKEVI